MLAGAGGDRADARRLLHLLRALELHGVMPEQLVDIRCSLVVQLEQAHEGALSETLLERSSIQTPLVVYAHVHASARLAGAGPGTDVAEHDGAPGRHVLEC